MLDGVESRRSKVESGKWKFEVGRMGTLSLENKLCISGAAPGLVSPVASLLSLLTSFPSPADFRLLTFHFRLFPSNLPCIKKITIFAPLFNRGRVPHN